MEKVMLVFPPAFEPTQPYLSLPSLTAFLRLRGVGVEQIDLNVEFFKSVLTDGFLSRCHDTNVEKFNRLDSKQELDVGEQEEYLQLSKAIAAYPLIRGRIERAVRGLKNLESFVYYNECRENLNLIKASLELISAAYFPSKIDFYSCGIGRSITNESLRHLTRDEAVNFFVGFFNDFVESRLKAGPKLVGISVVTKDQFVASLTLGRIIKERHPQTHVVLGGPFISRVYEFIASDLASVFDSVDGLVINEGETALYALVRQLDSDSRDFEKVPNYVFRRDGRVVFPKNIVKEEHCSLPAPDFDGLPLKDYFAPKLVLPVLFARGCYWGKCDFCIHKYPFGSYSNKRVSDFIEELKRLKEKHGTDFFSFCDEAVPPAALAGISKQLLENKLGVKWFTFARFDAALDDSRCSLLRTAGCEMLMLGLETASERVRELYHKGIPGNEKIVEILKALKDHGISVRLSTIVGLPTETPEEADETLRFIVLNKELVDRDFSVVSDGVFMLQKHSNTAKNAGEFGLYGLKPNKEDFGLTFFYKPKTGMSMLNAKRKYYYFIREITSQLWRFKYFPAKSKLYCFLLKVFEDAYRVDDRDCTALLKQQLKRGDESISRISASFDLNTIAKAVHENFLEDEAILLTAFAEGEKAPAQKIKKSARRHVYARMIEGLADKMFEITATEQAPVPA
ncbi:MAG: radical SAM protein [Candidatus Micrarchaeota archaeon]